MSGAAPGLDGEPSSGADPEVSESPATGGDPDLDEDPAVDRVPGRVRHVVVDAANVIGSRPDGWWRDRAGAARRLAARISSTLDDPAGLLGRLGLDPGPRAPDGAAAPVRVVVHLVLEGAARAAAADIEPGPALVVVLAAADGDATITAQAARLPDPVVITADRALRARVTAIGATTLGPAALLGAL